MPIQADEHPARDPAPTNEPAQAQPIRRWTPGKLAVQLVGLLIGTALFVWAIRTAFSEKNQPAIDKIREASLQDLAMLIALTILSLAINGLIFWLTMRPLRRLPLGETTAINCIAAFLSLVPFKLGLLLRAVIHYRRHSVPAAELAAWLAAFGGLSALSLVIFAGISWWRGGIDVLWWVGVAGGVLAGGAVVVLAGHIAQRLPWLARFSLVTNALTIARDPTAVYSHILLRGLDIATFGLRFWVASRIAGMVLDPADSMVMGSVYVLLNASAPAGSLGFAEAGTAFLANKVGVDQNEAALLALVITAAMSLTSGVLALAAWTWLRPDKLMAKQPSQPAT